MLVKVHPSHPPSSTLGEGFEEMAPLNGEGRQERVLPQRHEARHHEVPPPQAPHTYIRVFVLVDAMEVEGPAVDEELRAGDVDGTDADRERVHVLQQRPVHLRLHFHLDFQGGDTSDVLGFARMPCLPSLLPVRAILTSRPFPSPASTRGLLLTAASAASCGP